MDGRRYGKSNYAWTPPAGVKVSQAFILTLSKSLQHRRLPRQGAVLQTALLRRDRDLARHYAAKLSPECRHLVISQNLLPHLGEMGVLGGRTFDVLMERWPLEELQPRLALKALAMGIPVYATAECGLPDHAQLTVLDRADFAGFGRDHLQAGCEKMAGPL